MTDGQWITRWWAGCGIGTGVGIGLVLALGWPPWASPLLVLIASVAAILAMLHVPPVRRWHVK